MPLSASAGDPKCTFCGVVTGRTAAHVVWEDDATVSFLDKRPLFAGHVLVVPRRHLETLADVPADLLAPLFSRVQAMSEAMEAVLGAAGSFVALNNRISQSVPHVHIHVVPRNRKDGLRGFFWPRTKYGSDDEAASIAARLHEGLKSLDNPVL